MFRNYRSGYNAMSHANQNRNSDARPDNRTLPIEQAWALVAMADRINQGRYVKFIEYRQNPDNVSANEISFYPNRTLIERSLEKGEPAVTDQDRVQGRAMAEHFQGLALTALGGDMGDFDRNLLTIIQKDQVTLRKDMAFMACLGARYRRELAREAVAAQVNQVGGGSQFQGSIGENITRQVQILARFAARTFDGSVIRATDGDNLYFWTSSKPTTHWATDSITVKGAVKAHGTDQNGYRETRLTRVKIVS